MHNQSAAAAAVNASGERGSLTKVWPAQVADVFHVPCEVKKGLSGNGPPRRTICYHGLRASLPHLSSTRTPCSTGILRVGDCADFALRPRVSRVSGPPGSSSRDYQCMQPAATESLAANSGKRRAGHMARLHCVTHLGLDAGGRGPFASTGPGRPRLLHLHGLHGLRHLKRKQLESIDPRKRAPQKGVAQCVEPMGEETLATFPSF